jgi:hypothetical protein
VTAHIVIFIIIILEADLFLLIDSSIKVYTSNQFSTLDVRAGDGNRRFVLDGALVGPLQPTLLF